MRLISNAGRRATLLYCVCVVLFTFSITTSASLPNWFISVESDPTLVSDVGVGETLESAKQDALSNIAKSLHSQVSTTMESYVSTLVAEPQLGDSFVNKTSSHIQVSAKEIVLSVVTWTHSEQDEDAYYVRGQIKLAEWVAVNQNRLSAYLERSKR